MTSFGLSDCHCCVASCQRLVHGAIEAPSVAFGGHNVDTRRCRYSSHVRYRHICSALKFCTALGELDLHAATNWDKFYQQNKTNFFKDRHYLDREFPQLSAEHQTIFEACFTWFSLESAALRSCITVHVSVHPYNTRQLWPVGLCKACSTSISNQLA